MADVAEQIRQLFKDPTFSNRINLQNLKERMAKLPDGYVCDIRSSKWFSREILNNRTIMSDPRNIVLCFWADGVQPFHKKMKYSIDMMAHLILNLGPEERSKIASILMGGIISGPQKPKTEQPVLLLMLVR